MKNTKETISKKMDDKVTQIEALNYALYLVKQKHDEAVYVVQNVKTNVYYEDWCREEASLSKKIEVLKSVIDLMDADLDRLCRQYEKVAENE